MMRYSLHFSTTLFLAIVLALFLVTASSALANLNCPNGTTASFGTCVPTSEATGLNPGGPTGVYAVLLAVGQFMASIIGVLCILVILFGGINYMLSGGDEQRATQAKNIIKYAIYGLFFALIAWTIVNGLACGMGASGAFC